MLDEKLGNDPSSLFNGTIILVYIYIYTRKMVPIMGLASS